MSTFCEIKYEWDQNRATFSLFSSLDLLDLREYFCQLNERFFPGHSMVLEKYEIGKKMWYIIETDWTCKDVRVFYGNMINGTILENSLGEHFFKGQKYWNEDKVIRTSQLSVFDLQSISLIQSRRSFHHVLGRRLKKSTAQIIEEGNPPDAKLMKKLSEKYGIRGGKFIHCASLSNHSRLMNNVTDYEKYTEEVYKKCVYGWFNGELSLFNKLEMLRDQNIHDSNFFTFIFYHPISNFFQLLSSGKLFTMEDDPYCYEAFQLLKSHFFVFYKLQILSLCAINRNNLRTVGCYSLSTLEPNPHFMNNFKPLDEKKEDEIVRTD